MGLYLLRDPARALSGHVQQAAARLRRPRRFDRLVALAQDGPLARSQRVSSRRLREASGWAPRVRAGTDGWGRIAA